MGLLGEVTNAEVEAALKPQAYAVCPDGFEGDYLVDEVQDLQSGKAGDYYTAELVFTNDEGRKVRVFHTVSLSPKSRPFVIKFLKNVGLDPAQWEGKDELKGLVGRAVLKQVKKPNGDPKNEVAYFKN